MFEQKKKSIVISGSDIVAKKNFFSFTSDKEIKQNREKN